MFWKKSVRLTPADVESLANHAELCVEGCQPSQEEHSFFHPAEERAARLINFKPVNRQATVPSPNQYKPMCSCIQFVQGRNKKKVLAPVVQNTFVLHISQQRSRFVLFSFQFTASFYFFFLASFLQHLRHAHSQKSMNKIMFYGFQRKCARIKLYQQSRLHRSALYFYIQCIAFQNNAGGFKTLKQYKWECYTLDSWHLHSIRCVSRKAYFFRIVLKKIS